MANGAAKNAISGTVGPCLRRDKYLAIPQSRRRPFSENQYSNLSFSKPTTRIPAGQNARPEVACYHGALRHWRLHSSSRCPQRYDSVIAGIWFLLLTFERAARNFENALNKLENLDQVVDPPAEPGPVEGGHHGAGPPESRSIQHTESSCVPVY